MENYVFIFFVFLKTQLHECYQKKAFIFFNPFYKLTQYFFRPASHVVYMGKQ